MTTRKIDEYLSLNYTYRLIRDVAQGGYVAEHPELEGCVAQGETAEETIANLDVARELWIETRLEDGLQVPQPGAEIHSGRVSLRIASSVHARLTQHAQSCGISLNKLLNRILSDSIDGVGPVHGRQSAHLAPASRKTLAELMSFNYVYDLVRDEQEGGYFAEHPDLSGCAAQGDTAEEAIANLDVARELWIETRLEDGLPVSGPLPEDASGLISLRMSPSLHAQLVKQAARNRVSLNLWLNTVLAEFVGSLGVAVPTSASTTLERRVKLTEVEMASAAACLFRGGKVRIAEKLLTAWPKERADFLLGLFHLEAGQGEQAIYRFCSAHNSGLDFETDGTNIYYSFAERPPLRTLHENMLPLSHAIDMDSDKYSDIHGEVGGRIVDWAGTRRKENPQEMALKLQSENSSMRGPILLLEDEESLYSQVLQDLLKTDYGLEITRAEDIQGAEEILKTVRPSMILLPVVSEERKIRVIQWIKDLRSSRRYNNNIPVLVAQAPPEVTRYVKDVEWTESLDVPLYGEMSRKVAGLLASLKN